MTAPQTPGRSSDDDADDADDALARVGPRLRALRRAAGSTLAELSRTTGISVSTLSRLEQGRRRPTLELLLPLARAHRLGLDDLVGEPTEDPRVRTAPIRRHGATFHPLTRRPGAPSAYKVVLEPGRDRGEPRTHEGYEWVYVLSGRLHLLLGEHDLELGPGEAAEFDTRVPHRLSAAGDVPAELLTIFGPQGERVHVRARSR